MSSSSSDLSVRGERLRALTVGRALIATLLLVGLSTLGRAMVSADTWPLLAAAGTTYLTVQLLAWALPRRTPTLTRPVAEVALLVDAAALAVVLVATGGVHSPLAPLLPVQVVAVTLLFGRWAGLRAALLGSLAVLWLLPATPLLGATGEVLTRDPALGVAVDPQVRAILLLAVLWATTLVTGWLSTLTERELRGRTEDLTLLREITPDLDPRQGPDRVGQVVTEVVVDRLGHPAAALWTLESRTGARPSATAPGTGGEGAGPLVLTGRHGTRRHPSLLDADTALSPEEVEALAAGPLRPLRTVDPRPAALDALFGPDSPLLVATLEVEQRRLGLLAIEVGSHRRQRAVVRPRQLRVLRMLVEQASLLLDNARLQSELAEQATRDALTGLPNHRFFQQRLGEELDRVARRAERGEVRALSVALLDLDRFKAVNDTYGHPTGDRVLAAVGAAAASALRDTDVVCRYGGEEFGIVLVDSDAEAARSAAERVRRAIREVRVDAVDGRPLGPIPASVGVATVAAAAEPRAAVVDRADTALYAAKRAGRDRVVHHDDLPVIDLEANEPSGPPVTGPTSA